MLALRREILLLNLMPLLLLVVHLVLMQLGFFVLRLLGLVVRFLVLELILNTGVVEASRRVSVHKCREG
jgi:hypothetical protein